MLRKKEKRPKENILKMSCRASVEKGTPLKEQLRKPRETGVSTRGGHAQGHAQGAGGPDVR